jgi:hypothetical protein
MCAVAVNRGTWQRGLRGAAAACGLVAALTCLGACAQGGRQTAAPQHNHKSLYSFGRWVGPRAGARSLYFAQVTDSTFAFRGLIATPNGAALVLSSLIDAPTGESRTRVAADVGGWWLEVRETTDIKAELLYDYYDQAAAGENQRWRLESSDGTQVESDRMEGLVAALRSRGRIEVVRNAVPKEVIEARQFLYAITGRHSDYEALRPPVLVLAQLFGEQPQEDARWKLVVEHFGKHLNVNNPEAIRFLAGFHSVTAENPMGDFDAERALLMRDTVEGIRRAREATKQHPR